MSVMDDIEALRAECDRLRKLAHDAPFNPYRLDHDGHVWIEIRSYAWATRGREWMEAKRRLDAAEAKAADAIGRA